jgi:DNA-binding SARP family transcriptional activator
MALVAARSIGDPGRLQRREPEILAALGHLDAENVRPPLRISLLGGFRVGSGSDDVTPAAGHPATLVKLIALRGSMTSEEAIDALWPDADLNTGRTRLRNLLHRIRSTSGGLLDRREDSLVLADGVDVDVTRFEQDVQLALAAPLAERAGLARRALQRYAGELLPGDLYTDFAAPVRERLHRLHLAMLDLVADDSLLRGDIDEALRLLDQAIMSEPTDESRYVKAARGLVTQGRRRSALALLQRAAATSEELGVPPSRDLRELLGSLS